MPRGFRHRDLLGHAWAAVLIRWMSFEFRADATQRHRAKNRRFRSVPPRSLHGREDATSMSDRGSFSFHDVEERPLPLKSVPDRVRRSGVTGAARR